MRFAAVWAVTVLVGCGGTGAITETGVSGGAYPPEGEGRGAPEVIATADALNSLPVGTILAATDNVNLRTQAGTSYPIITVVPEGARVRLVSPSPRNGFYKISYAGQVGWSYGLYYRVVSIPPTPADAGSATVDAGSPAPVDAGAPPDSSDAGTPATDAGTSTDAGNGTVDAGAPGDAGTVPGYPVGTRLQATDNVNLRTGPSTSDTVLEVVPTGATVVTVEVTTPTNGYYKVNYNGTVGWTYGIYYQPVAPPPAGSDGGTPAPPTSGATGDRIADYALQYVGYPYVYAGAGPDAFDCSGFTMWVVQHVLGKNITHSLQTQWDLSTHLAKADLQRGDLVFFQNTFDPGLSHVGIYTGNGQFVHAENETTGVKVSQLGSQYYTEHWFGAGRIY